MSPEVQVALIGALATIVAALIGVAVHRRRRQDGEGDAPLSTSPEARRRRHKYDLFVSSPLAAFDTDEELMQHRECVGQVVALTENQFGFSVYWAGRNIRSKADFEAADLSAQKDVAAILESKFFLMLYPKKVASSVLFEAGIALQSCLTSLYFIKSQDDLPFLMKQASQAFRNVRTYPCATIEEHLALLKKHGKGFFNPTREQ